MKNLYILLVATFLTAFSQNTYSQQWFQIGEDIEGLAAGDESGNSIDLSGDGNIIAISAWQNDDNGEDAGHVRIFENIDGIWTQIGNAIEGEAGEKKGFAVSINDSGNIVALSTPYYNSNAGKVSIYQNTGGVWTQIGEDIIGIDQGDYSGVAIDLNSEGNIIAVSNHGSGSNNLGVIRLFEFNDGTWNNIAEMSGNEWNEQLGGGGLMFNSDATVLAAKPTSGTYYPYIRVFKKSTKGTWDQVGDSIPKAGSSFALSRDGLTVAAGNRGYYNGQVYIYKNIDDTWIPKGDTIALPHPAVGYSLFTQLSSDGNLLVVSQPGDGNGLILTYSYREGKWVKSNFEFSGEGHYDNFGIKMSLCSNDSILAISAPKNDGNGDDAGHVRIFNFYECAAVKEEISLSVCENELPYTFGEQALSESGEYTETFTTTNGCDSTVMLHFSTNITYNDTISEIISDAEIPYLFGSQSLNTSGVYTENFMSVNGCDSLVTLNLTVSITGNNVIESQEEKISIYPNPSTGIVYIMIEDQSLNSVQVAVYDLSMRKILRSTFNTDQLINLDLSGLPSGQYLTTIKTDDNMISQKIILIE